MGTSEKKKISSAANGKKGGRPMELVWVTLRDGSRLQVSKTIKTQMLRQKLI